MSPKLLHSATFRLATLYVLLFALSVGILFVLLYFSMRATLEGEIRTRILNEVNLLLHEYREDGLDELLEETEERIEKNEPGEQRLIYMVQNPSGQVVFDDLAPVTEPLGWRRSDGTPARLMHFTQLDDSYVLGVGQDLGSIESIRQAFLRAFTWSIAAVVIIGFAGGMFLSRRTLSQIDAITRTAVAIGDGKLSQRIESRGTGDEIDTLGETLNQMLNRIESLIANVRQVSSGIAHDLRSPLTRLRNRLESLRAETASPAVRSEVEAAIEDLDGILETFAALLRLAELESGALKSGFLPVDLSELAQQVADFYRPLAEESDARIETEVHDRVEVSGNSQLLRQMIANLIENALRHAGTGITLHIAVTMKKGQKTLEVADSGPGIPAAERDRMKQPFERLNPDRPGSGLGLTLIAAIARLHDASFELLDNEPGLLCRLTFTDVNNAGSTHCKNTGHHNRKK